MINKAQLLPLIVANATPEQTQSHHIAIAAWKTMNAEAEDLIHSICKKKSADKIEDLIAAAER